MFLVEGPRCVQEALTSDLEVEEVFATSEALDALAETASTHEAQVTEVSDDVLRSMSDAVTPQGIVAVARKPQRKLTDVLPAELVLVLAGLRDPGNAGTLVRSALAVGAGVVVFAEESVDPYSPKVVRSSAGSLFRVNAVEEATPLGWADKLEKYGTTLIAAEAEGSESLYDAPLEPPVAFVVGNEAWGLPDAVRNRLHRTVGIPMPGPVESLNAAIAGSVLLFEMVRRGLLESASHG
jgi:TrmH family RNA methyltransferase